jgi:two-component system response regulator AtoC
MQRVLIVDDDRPMRRTLQLVIERMGLASVAVSSAAEARQQLAAGRFDLVLTDLRMPHASGLDLLRDVRAQQPSVPVVLITAFGTLQTAIEAMRHGAADYVLKPFDNDSLERTVDRVLERERVRSDNLFLREQAGQSWAAEDVFLALPGMRAVAEMIDKIAAMPSAVLLTGETGTGKELAARCIHRASPRRERLFVPLNCAALPAELLEAELFGHARGAFTGAERARRGRFELADGGTLFLDEIGDMPLALQAKLLRVLEDGAIEPLGTNDRVRVDVRVVSATNQDLKAAIAAKRFRSDLYFRLNTFEIHLAPLRERAADLDVLAPLFLDRIAREIGKGAMHLSEPARALLHAYNWPGNIRELRTLMERAAVLSSDGTVGDRFFAAMIDVPPTAAAAPDDPAASDDDLPLAAALDRFERGVLLRVLNATRDNKAEAARRLGVSERTLWYKLKKHGL